MDSWKKTSCVLCAQNCGLEMRIRDNRIVKVRPDKDNPRSQGYICRKGGKVARHQHHGDRLTHPLKRTKRGFIKISWDQAIGEIARKLGAVIDKHGPRSFAFMGGGGQGCHFDALFALQFLRLMGSRYHYNALGQELTGNFWGAGRVLGRQNRFPVPHEHDADMLLAIGWNGMVSHQMPRAPLVLREFSKNPDKLLVVVDPRKSETAAIADIHLPVTPGTDALLTRAMIAIILENGWEDTEYLRAHATGLEDIRPWFTDFDAREAVKVCGLDYIQVVDLCHLLVTRKWAMHPDLGVLMNRHSTATTYLELILAAICGRLCVPGGNVIPGTPMPLGLHTDERAPDTWRTVATNFPALMGYFPPNVLPEEILSDHPERVRAVLTCASNPLRSYADTTAYEEAFSELDLLVTIELAMTETAAMADYVLPARSGYESWDGTFFPYTYPEVYFQMRQPVLEPEGEQLECGRIFTRLARAMGVIPDIPESLRRAAGGSRAAFAAELAAYVRANPENLKSLSFIMSETVGEQWGSAHLSMLWGMLQLSLVNYKAPDGELLGAEEIPLRLADGKGLLPEEGSRDGGLSALPLALAGKTNIAWLVENATALWGLSRVRPSRFFQQATRQGFTVGKAMARQLSGGNVRDVLGVALKTGSPAALSALGPVTAVADLLYNAILEHPEGIWIGKADPDSCMKDVATPSGRIELHAPEMADWITGITPQAEARAIAPDPDFPLVLMAGRHTKVNANTLMRDPSWNEGIRACTLAMHPEDAQRLKLADGQRVRVATEAGEEFVELEVTDQARPGQVLMPHGFGLVHEGKVYGANVNRLTKNTHRDPFAGTPLHRFVRCRVEAA